MIVSVTGKQALGWVLVSIVALVFLIPIGMVMTLEALKAVGIVLAFAFSVFVLVMLFLVGLDLIQGKL